MRDGEKERILSPFGLDDDVFSPYSFNHFQAFGVQGGIKHWPLLWVFHQAFDDAVLQLLEEKALEKLCFLLSRRVWKNLFMMCSFFPSALRLNSVNYTSKGTRMLRLLLLLEPQCWKNLGKAAFLKKSQWSYCTIINLLSGLKYLKCALI